MALYYLIGDVLDRVEKAGTDPSRLDMLVPVSETTPRTAERPEDVFQLSSHPKLFDISSHEAVGDLLMLIDEAPLYAVNLELTLDRALTQAHRDRKLDAAMRRAFGREPLPASLPEAAAAMGEPSLRHPILGHMDRLRLCEIYIALIKDLEPFHGREFNFEADILGKHPQRFLDLFEGYVTPYGSKVRAAILLAFGIRLDHDPGQPLENYVDSGQRKVMRMRITEPKEMLWAWLEADHHQMRHCRDLDRTLRIEGLPRRPNWVRYDVFALLEKEAVKQKLAENYTRADRNFTLLAKAPAIRRAIQAHAEGIVDETLRQLLSQTLNMEESYSGSALRFAEAAVLREREASMIGKD